LTKASADDRFGIEYEAEKKTIHIIGIAEDSLMDKWNMENPGREVRAGDRVVEVNRTRAKPQTLIGLLETEDTVDLLVTRQVIAADTLDGFWRTCHNKESVYIRKSKARFGNEKTWTLRVRGNDGITATRSNGETYRATLVDGELHWDDQDVWVRDYQEYRIENDVLNANSKGLAYRTEQHLEARAPEDVAGFAKWGDTITAHDLENGWVCVHIDYETYYLPTHVQGIQVLIPQPPARRASASEEPREAAPEAKWSRADTIRLCEEDGIATYQGKCVVIDKQVTTSATKAVEMLNAGDVDTVGTDDFVVFFSERAQAWCILHKAGLREAALSHFGLHDD
jgi:hypothetical protein